MKNKSVCKGCKYYLKKSSTPFFNNTCNYIGKTGRSRLVVEMQNGGVKQDSCICFEARRKQSARKVDD